MTKEPSKAPPLYPKTHLLAASGIAALLSLALLVFPSSDVEAKKTTLSLELESPAEQLTQDQDAADAVQATNEPAASPFAQIDNSAEDTRKPLNPRLLRLSKKEGSQPQGSDRRQGDASPRCSRKSAFQPPQYMTCWPATSRPSSSVSSSTARNSERTELTAS
jgi:outer membrane murein-binding lipoprotein Lpp